MAIQETLARRRGERGYEAWTLCLPGEIASHHDHPDVTTVEIHYGAAMALTSELGMHSLVAYCHLGLEAVSPDRRPHEGRGAPDNRRDDVPRDGHGLLG